MTNCFLCGQKMKAATGCDEDRLIEFEDGETATPIAYGDAPHYRDQDGPTQACHDCGAMPGEFHHPGCDMERCPQCGGQYFICNCHTSEKAIIWGE